MTFHCERQIAGITSSRAESLRSRDYSKMSAKVERNFRAAICAEGARGASTVHGDLEIAGRTDYGDGLPRRSQRKCWSELSDFLAANGELDGAGLNGRGGNFLGGEIRHQIAECIHAQYDSLDRLSRGLCFRHGESHAVGDFFAERLVLK